MPNNASHRSAVRPPLRDRQRGAAIVEVLMLAVPLCVLIMVVTSKLAATSAARLQAQWQASLATQLDTRGPCGIDPLLSSGPVVAVALKPKATKALLPLAFGADLLFTNDKTKKVTVPVDADYWFHGQATRAIPDGIESASAEATFLCNNAMGDNGRTLRGVLLTGLGFWQARKLFTGSGQDIKSPDSPLDKPPQEAADQANGVPKNSPQGSLPDDLKSKIEDANKNGVPTGTAAKIKDLPTDVQGDLNDELSKRPQYDPPQPKK